MLLRYWKRLKALEFIRDNSKTTKSDVKKLFGNDGLFVFEDAKKMGSIYPNTMGVSYNRTILDSQIIQYKNLLQGRLYAIIKWVVGLLIGGIAITICINITINSVIVYK